MNGVLHLTIGSLGLAFAFLVLRADPRRWDNRAFAILGSLDAAMALCRGVAGAYGIDIANRSLMGVCASISPLLAWWSVEFVYSFPHNQKLPWRWRLPLLAWTAGAMVCVLDTFPWSLQVAELGYFIPVMFVVIGLARRNLGRHTGDRFGVRLVVVAVTLRWLSANVLYTMWGLIDLDTWRNLLWIESTAGVLLAFILISFANIRSNLFTMRSAIGELALESAFVLSGLLLTAGAVEGALRLAATSPRSERPLLMLAALVPLVVYAIAERLRPRLQASIDPRRAMRREIVDRALRASQDAPAESLIATSLAALGEVTDGGEARFLSPADLPAELAATLSQAGCDAVRSEALGAPAPGELVVGVRLRDRLDGAIAVRGGIYDRETSAAALLLAGRIALALEHNRLLGALEESRRLAALGAFAAAIAHDIRTPLTSVQMNVQILRGKAKLPPDDMEYFDIALDELRRLEDHVKQLLDYSKPLQLHRETIQLADLTDDAARTVEPLLAERRQRLECVHDDTLPAVSCDPHRMKQVLWNLLENAAKASPTGATIAVHTRRDGPRVAIDVVDPGAGIAAGDLARIFEPFFTTRPDGTGLGLAICQKVVKAHDGEIRVQSEPAAGSTFTVLLPAT